jgi:hypothetical protein
MKGGEDNRESAEPEKEWTHGRNAEERLVMSDP